MVARVLHAARPAGLTAGSLERRPAAPSFAEAVTAWWADARTERDRYPWRGRSDPWGILVSEVMLTQTQAARVAAPFVGFMEAFPTPAACAVAAPGDLLRAWQGLGYNGRALRLHRCAEVIVNRHGGEVPEGLDQLLALPGVGAYVARALAAFAFDTSVGVVDTNIGRVLARAVAGSRLGPRAAQDLADSLVPAAGGRDWNLALMDLGSLLCRKAAPRCSECPVAASGSCAWRAAGGDGDPAVGSAAAGRRQSAFGGSDRQYRGRIVAIACERELSRDEVAPLIGLAAAPERALRILGDLVREGFLVERLGGALTLP